MTPRRPNSKHDEQHLPGTRILHEARKQEESEVVKQVVTSVKR
jgi:hypothetical protein